MPPMCLIWELRTQAHHFHTLCNAVLSYAFWNFILSSLGCILLHISLPRAWRFYIADRPQLGTCLAQHIETFVWISFLFCYGEP